MGRAWASETPAALKGANWVTRCGTTSPRAARRQVPTTGVRNLPDRTEPNQRGHVTSQAQGCRVKTGQGVADATGRPGHAASEPSYEQQRQGRRATSDLRAAARWAETLGQETTRELNQRDLKKRDLELTRSQENEISRPGGLALTQTLVGRDPPRPPGADELCLRDSAPCGRCSQAPRPGPWNNRNLSPRSGGRSLRSRCRGPRPSGGSRLQLPAALGAPGMAASLHRCLCPHKASVRSRVSPCLPLTRALGTGTPPDDPGSSHLQALNDAYKNPSPK